MVSKIFFSSNLVGRIFFSLLNSLQYFFSSKKVTCLHIQNILTFIAVFFFLKTGSTRVLSFLRLFSKGHNIEATH